MHRVVKMDKSPIVYMQFLGSQKHFRAIHTVYAHCECGVIFICAASAAKKLFKSCEEITHE